MTLPRNFPGRVNARRVRALNAMRSAPAPRKRPRANPQSFESRQAERARLIALIVDQNFANGLRTKKDHSHMARLRSATAAGPR